jgi:hypothetical protein
LFEKIRRTIGTRGRRKNSEHRKQSIRNDMETKARRSAPFTGNLRASLDADANLGIAIP